MQERRKRAGRVTEEPSGNSLFRLFSEKEADAVGREYPVFKPRGMEHITKRVEGYKEGRDSGELTLRYPGNESRKRRRGKTIARYLIQAHCETRFGIHKLPKRKTIRSRIYGIIYGKHPEEKQLL